LSAEMTSFKEFNSSSFHEDEAKGYLYVINEYSLEGIDMFFYSILKISV
jgi:hypothetical protein